MSNTNSNNYTKYTGWEIVYKSVCITSPLTKKFLKLFMSIEVPVSKYLLFLDFQKLHVRLFMSLSTRYNVIIYSKYYIKINKANLHKK